MVRRHTLVLGYTSPKLIASDVESNRDCQYRRGLHECTIQPDWLGIGPVDLVKVMGPMLRLPSGLGDPYAPIKLPILVPQNL